MFFSLSQNITLETEWVVGGGGGRVGCHFNRSSVVSESLCVEHIIAL